jgi:Tol biopolymer transport system component
VPDFDTRTPQGADEPNGLSTMPTEIGLRTLLIGGGIFLFTVAVSVGLLIYSSGHPWAMCAADESADGAQRQAASIEDAKYKIAFVRSGDIYTVDSDGSNETNLVNSVSHDFKLLAWSSDGTKLALVKDKPGAIDELYATDSDGTHRAYLADYRTYMNQGATISPDGTKIAFANDPEEFGEYDIYTVNPDGSGLKNSTSTLSGEGYPVFSPDGEKIAFTRQRQLGHYGGGSGDTRGTLDIEIYVMERDGGWVRNITNTRSIREEEPAFSPDGERIIYVSPETDNSPYQMGNDIHVMNSDGSCGRRLTSTAAVAEEYPVISPDGANIAFRALSEETLPGSDMYVMSADGSGRKRLTSGMTIANYVFSPDGEKIAFSAYRRVTYGAEEQTYETYGAEEQVYVTNLDGSEPTLVIKNYDERAPITWIR